MTEEKEYVIDFYLLEEASVLAKNKREAVRILKNELARHDIKIAKVWEIKE